MSRSRRMRSARSPPRVAVSCAATRAGSATCRGSAEIVYARWPIARPRPSLERIAPRGAGSSTATLCCILAFWASLGASTVLIHVARTASNAKTPIAPAASSWTLPRLPPAGTRPPPARRRRRRSGPRAGRVEIGDLVGRREPHSEGGRAIDHLGVHALLAGLQRGELLLDARLAARHVALLLGQPQLGGVHPDDAAEEDRDHGDQQEPEACAGTAPAAGPGERGTARARAGDGSAGRRRSRRGARRRCHPATRTSARRRAEWDRGLRSSSTR